MRIAFLLIALLVCFSVHSQDTITYSKIQSIGKTYVHLESLELYGDSTFTWTSTHDLQWSEYGVYTISDDTLFLEFYYGDIDGFHRDSIDWHNLPDTLEPRRTQKCFIDGKKMFKVLPNGKLEKWTREKTLFKDSWRWLFLGFRKTFYRLEE